MYRALFLCLLLSSLTSCASTSSGNGGGSRQMQAIVHSLRVDEYTLDTSRFYSGWDEEFEMMTRQNRMEVYRLPKPPGADTYRYSVYYDKGSEQYWVTRVGGVSGSTKLWGPIDFKE